MVSIKDALKQSPDSLKQAMRWGLVCPLRAYLRFAPTAFAKKTLWDRLATRLWWLESYITTKTVFGSTLRVDTSDGVGKYIYYFGIWEPNLTAWIQTRLAPGDAFIDVGANVGYYSVLASKLVGEVGKVVAIEAHPQIFSLLQNNLQTNGAGNVRFVNVAAWDCERSLTIFTRGGHTSGATTLVPSWAGEWRMDERCEVPTAPLSTILQPAEIKAARIIKIDVEGAEWQVVSGLAPLIGELRRDVEIVVEVTPSVLEAEGRSGKDLLRLFGDCGFHSYRIENDYSAASYYARITPSRPERIKQIPAGAHQADLVFSRVDASSL